MVGVPGLGSSKALNVNSGILPVLTDTWTRYLRRQAQGVSTGHSGRGGRTLILRPKPRIKLMFKDSHYAAVLGRALISIPFFLSGIGKIATPAVTQGYIAAAGLPLPWVGYAIAVAVVVGGGLFLLFGIKTRLAAVALAIFTVVAARAFTSDFSHQ